MQLPFLLLDFVTELIQQLVVLQDQSFFFPGILFETLSLALVKFVKSVGPGPLVVSLVESGGQLVLELFVRPLHVPLPRLHLALVDLGLLRALLLRH